MILKWQKNVKAALLWFEAASGLQVNMSKTKVYKIGEVGYWDKLVQKWKCKIGTLQDI